MLAQVPTADVIVTNPTHYAVALRYDRGVDQAPVILAKGENQFARRIKAMAAEHGVPVVENKPVARMLYALGRVDEPIPGELYQAVAEILAFVYRTHRYYFFRLRARRNQAAAAAAAAASASANFARS
jgi:flagellar biosynthetic protein FlhB